MIVGLSVSLIPRGAGEPPGWPMPVLGNPHNVPLDLFGVAWKYDPDGDDLIAFKGKTVAAVVNLPNLTINVANGFACGVFALLFTVPRPVPVSAGRCANCRYDLMGNTSGVCPECGTVARRVPGGDEEGP